MNGDLYVILGVSERAAESEIKKAYRRLARKYHPDINPGDRGAEERFKKILEAYEVLSDPEKRGFYDENGYFVEGVLESRTSTSWSFRFGGSENPGATASDFGDVFDGLFNQTRSRDPDTDNDVEAHISITFAQSIAGLETFLDVHRKRLCPACDGSGFSDGPGENECPGCSGTGQYVKAKGYLRFSMTCPKCAGTGRIPPACSQCGGQGRLPHRERLRVRIPAGVNTGSRVRVEGQGSVDPKTRRPGDLYVLTNVGSHPFFRRAGDNIHCTVPVTITEAALGAKIEVPTLDGPALLRVPPGVQPGRTLRLRGKGAPSLRGHGVRGDQYVEIRVVIPRVADERSRALLRELGRLNSENPREDLVRYAR